MKLNKLLPDLYNNNIEMNALINSEDTEFNEILNVQIETSFKNNFIATADSNGLTRYENLLDLPIMTLDELEDEAYEEEDMEF